MVDKKNPKTGKIDDDLRGFEEVFDLLDDERDKKRSSERYVNPHELLNFLEKENDRLNKLDLFFSDKAPNLMTNPTTQNLCELQEENIAGIQKELWRELKKPQSIFLKNLSLLFDKVYK